jgi:hypothetical protein
MFSRSHAPPYIHTPAQVEKVGFMLKPFCFFAGNPGVDLPHSVNAASKLAGQAACCAANGTANGVH